MVGRQGPDSDRVPGLNAGRRAPPPTCCSLPPPPDPHAHPAAWSYVSTNGECWRTQLGVETSTCITQLVGGRRIGTLSHTLDDRAQSATTISLLIRRCQHVRPSCGGPCRKSFMRLSPSPPHPPLAGPRLRSVAIRSPDDRLHHVVQRAHPPLLRRLCHRLFHPQAHKARGNPRPSPSHRHGPLSPVPAGAVVVWA